MYLYKVGEWPQCMRLQQLGNATTHARMYSRQVSMDISMDFGRLLGSRGAWDSPAREELLSPSDHCKINPLAPPMQSNGIGGLWRPVASRAHAGGNPGHGTDHPRSSQQPRALAGASLAQLLPRQQPEGPQIQQLMASAARAQILGTDFGHSCSHASLKNCNVASVARPSHG